MLQNPVFRCFAGFVIGCLLILTLSLLNRWRHERAVARRWRGKPALRALLLLLMPLALLAGGGCGTPPLTQVYAARQAYTGSLNGLTTAINAGQINDRATLLKIKDFRAKIEKGLDDAETKARAGDKIGAQFIMDQVTGWLEEYLLLQKPANRPTSLYMEPLWTPQRSSPSFWAQARLLPDWYQPMRLLPPAEPSPMSRWLASARSRLQLRLGTTLQ